jgi:hypothetical protein
MHTHATATISMATVTTSTAMAMTTAITSKTTPIQEVINFIICRFFKVLFLIL